MSSRARWVRGAVAACCVLAVSASTAFAQDLFKLSPPAGSWRSGNIQMTLSKNVLHPQQGNVTINQVSFYYNPDVADLADAATVLVGTKTSQPFNTAFNSAGLSGPVPGWTDGAGGTEGEIDDEFFIMAEVQYTHSVDGTGTAIIGAPDPDADPYSAESGGHPIRIDNQRPRPATLKQLGRFVGDAAPYRNENFFTNFFNDRRMIGYTVGDTYEVDPVNSVFTEEYRGMDGTLLGDPPYTADEKIFVCSGFNPLDYVSFDITHTSIAPPAGHVDAATYEDWDTAIDHWDTTVATPTNRGVGIVGYKVDWDQTAPDVYEATAALNTIDSSTYTNPIDRTDLTDGDTDGDTTAYWVHVTTFDGVRTGQNTLVYNRSVTVHYGPIWKITIGPVIECPSDDIVLSGCDLSTDPTVSVEVELNGGGTKIIQIPLDLDMLDDPDTVPDESDPQVLFDLLGGFAGPPMFPDGTEANLEITLELMTDLDTVTPSGGTGCIDDPYVYTLVYRATDDCGNFNECTWEVKVADLTPPDISGDLDPIAVQCEGDVPAAVDSVAALEAMGVTIADNCTDDTELEVTASDTALTDPCGGTITRTYTVTDECGNAAEVEQTITVDDTIAPTLPASLDPVSVQCPGDIPPPASTIAEFEAQFGAVTDNCSADDDLVITSSDTDLTDPCGGTITRTYTITDECGNAAQIDQTITVDDTEPPEIPPSLPGVNVQCEANIPAPALTVAEFEAQFGAVSDNCSANDDLTLASSDSALTDPCGGSVTRTYTITDECGNEAEVTQTITVNDTEAPDAPASVDAVTVECIADIPAAVTTVAEFEAEFGVQVSDNCSLDSDLILTYEDSSLAGGCGEAMTRTYTITDECGNETEVTQSITVDDTTKPTVPETLTGVTVDCEADIPAAVTTIADFESEFGVTVSDNCSDVDDLTLTSSDSDLTDPCGGSLTRTYTITDECGNAAQATQVITVSDEEAPDIDCPPDVTVDCTASTDPSNTGEATATDNCDTDVSITYADVETAGDCGQEKTIERTWTATDDCGNSSSCVQIITVTDETAPTITCPADITIECDESTDPSNTGMATATDDCDPDPVVTYTDGVEPGSCDDAKYIYRTWTATDDCGNVAQCIQVITVVDTTVPTIDCPPDVTIECDESIDPANTGWATADDNCDDDVEITYDDETTPATGSEYVITRTWTATDNCGNSASCEQTITVVDDTLPTITCPADITIECDESDDPDNTGWATAEDNCDDDPEITYEDNEIAGACADAKTIERTWTATDVSGNSASCTQIITVQDTTNPEITCPDDITIECDESDHPDNTGWATAEDNCDNDVAITYDDAVTGGAGNEYVIKRTWTATDNCGNSVSCEQTITVVDDTAPEITCPADITVECDESTDPSNTGAATATDNCDQDVDITYEDEESPGPCPQEKTISRTWTATDAAGNESTCVQTITVVDTTVPAIDCPPDITIECDQSTDPSNTGAATATDNCDPSVSIDYTDEVSSGNCPQSYTITRTWIATDACGNSSECEQTIVVVDTTAPEITCPADTVVECPDSTDPDDTGWATATDNCDEDVQVSYDDETTAGACPQEYTITRTWTAVDACGNESTCIQVIEVQDTTAPDLFCPDDITVECDESTHPDDTGWADASDDCDPAPTVTYSDSEAAGDCPQEKVITRTWTAEDACGNVATCEQTITVVDTTAPEITAQPSDDSAEGCASDLESLIADWLAANGGATATDNCGTVTWTNDFAAGNIEVPTECVAGVVAYVDVVFTAWDECDNSTDTDSARFSVTDTTAPTIDTQPQDGSEEGCSADDLDSLIGTWLASQGGAVATDNCGGSLAWDHDYDSDNIVVPSDCVDKVKAYVDVVFTVLDECGNSTDTDSARFSVVDTTAPTCVANPLTVYLGPDSTYTLTPADILAIAEGTEDNCGGDVSLSVDPMIFDCDDIGENTVTLTAEDECGNISTCETTVTVIDFVTVTVGTGYTIMYPDGNSGAPFELAGPGNWVTVPISACHCEDLTQLVFSIDFDAELLEYIVESQVWITPKMNVSGPFANPDWVNIELGVSEEVDGALGPVGHLIVHIDSPTGEPVVHGGCGEFMSLMFRVTDDDYALTGFTTLPLDAEVIYATGMNGLEVGKAAEDGVIYADLCNWILDVDRNGRVDPHTDGVILYRALKYGHLVGDTSGELIVPILPPAYAAAVGAYLPSDDDIVDYVDAVTDGSLFGAYFNTDGKADGPSGTIGGEEVSASRDGVYIYRNLAGFPNHIYPYYTPPGPYNPFVNPTTPSTAGVTVPPLHTDNVPIEFDINAQIDLLKILWCPWLENGIINDFKVLLPPSGIELPLDPAPELPPWWYIFAEEKWVPLPQPYGAPLGPPVK